jgi:hypothetical protein
MLDDDPRTRQTPRPTQKIAASDRAHRALARQRDEHQPDDVDVDDEGIGAIVNNTGLDGDAATG